jgi:thiol-disulfide isomerase/thioredoxin
VIPFSSKPGKTRFKSGSQLNPKLINNSWKLILNKGQENESKSIANFEKFSNELISSNFRTNTGDYGFLEGVVNKNTITLSTFNGSRAYLIEAEIIGDSIFGLIYQGNHGRLTIEGSIDNSFELDDEYSLTRINNSKQGFNFEFEDLDGKLISLSDEKYLNKAVVVQIMGSWCPNCLDETKFYIDYLNNNNLDGVEFIALAFEYSKTKKIAISNILKLKKELDIPYSILLAQYGSSDKKLAKTKLPMLEEIISYPTTIFLNKNKEVVKIHTGFNGPATGLKYDEFKVEFNNTIELLLKD